MPSLDAEQKRTLSSLRKLYTSADAASVEQALQLVASAAGPALLEVLCEGLEVDAEGLLVFERAGVVAPEPARVRAAFRVRVAVTLAITGGLYAGRTVLRTTVPGMRYLPVGPSLQAIEEIHLTDATHLVDISSLAELPRLSVLTIECDTPAPAYQSWVPRVAEPLTGMGGLSTLQELAISCVPIGNLDEVSRLVNLRCLRLCQGSAPDDISALRSMTNLRVLDLSMGYIRGRSIDLEPLYDLGYLSELQLPSCWYRGWADHRTPGPYSDSADPRHGPELGLLRALTSTNVYNRLR